MSRITRPILALCAAVAAMLAWPSETHAQRNCPTVEDTLVYVQPNQPAAIHLPVVNADDSEVTVFQFPLGGELFPTGPTQLDYVFVPDPDFSGRTTFTLRVSPPRGCGNGTLLATVTLAGGRATETVDLGGRIGVAPALCGLGASAVPLLACVFFACARFARRRRRA